MGRASRSKWQQRAVVKKVVDHKRVSMFEKFGAVAFALLALGAAFGVYFLYYYLTKVRG